MDSGHRQALISLQRNKTIVIKPADKGGNTVILDSVQYRDMCNKILSYMEWYKPSSVDEMECAHSRLLDIVIESNMNRIIDVNMKEFLINRFPCTPVFYALPKIHKVDMPLPGRPIVSAIGISSEKTSTLLDDYLRPYVLRLLC